jgi:hypothetical protein
MAHLAAVKRSPSDRRRLGVGAAPTRDQQPMTDDEVLNEARADGFELIERLRRPSSPSRVPNRARRARSGARGAAELSLTRARSE